MALRKIGIFCFGRKISNIGDQIQKIGFLNAIEGGSINVSEISRIYGYDTRKNEPITYIAYGYFDYQYGLDMFPMTEEFPIFLSTHCTDEKRIVDFEKLKNRIPFFGCRDYATYEFMKKNMPDIPCFISGCFSLIQDKRREEVRGNKYYLVDVNEKLRPYIPKYILENCIEATHDGFVFDEDNEKADADADAYVRNWLNMLRNDAIMVITTRLHCALPCVAMGIPVIVARDYRDNTDRYTGFEKLFHVYMPDEYPTIDWNPHVIDIEDVKKKIIYNVTKTFNAMQTGVVYENEFVEEYLKDWQKVHEFFLPQKYEPYYVGEFAGYLSHKQKLQYLNCSNVSIIEYITGKTLPECILVIYGAGDRGSYFINRYEEDIKLFKDVFYVDGDINKQCTSYRGIPIKSPQILSKITNVVIIVAVDKYYSKNGREISKWLSNDLGFREGKDFLMIDKLDSSSRLELTKAVFNAPLL